MDLTNIKDLRTALKLAGIKPNKELGQHFLVDQLVLDKIINSADLTETDTVLEIGPGIGTLTAALVQRTNHVIVVERDHRFVSVLRSQFPGATVVEEDFLSYDLSRLSNYKVVANLPYYVTSKIIHALLNTDSPPRSITVLVQKEVAERIVARPGQMSVLAFSVQYYGQPKLIDIVPASSFWPAPEVDSAILHIDIRSQPAFNADVKSLFKLVKAGFSERRKMLKNSLAGGLRLDSDTVSTLLIKSSLAQTARAQELSLGQWQDIYQQAIKMDLI